MRKLFMGTGEIALPSFRMMAEEGDLAGLVTQPDRPVGRSAKPCPPRIKKVAAGFGIPVVQPEKVGLGEGFAEVAALEPDLIVVMAYGQILPRALLEMPRYGCINVHASLLPRHRGASCIQAAIEAGDRETGISVIYMEEKLDTGDIITRQAVPLHPDDTGGIVHDRLAELAPVVLKEFVDGIAGGEVSRNPQDDSQARFRVATKSPCFQRNDNFPGLYSLQSSSSRHRPPRLGQRVPPVARPCHKGSATDTWQS